MIFDFLQRKYLFVIYNSLNFLILVSFKNKEGYVEKKLKDILERELAYIEERTEWEKGAKDYFGDKMYETLKEINESRQEALLSDSGNGCE